MIINIEEANCKKWRVKAGDIVKRSDDQSSFRGMVIGESGTAIGEIERFNILVLNSDSVVITLHTNHPYGSLTASDVKKRYTLLMPSETVEMTLSTKGGER